MPSEPTFTARAVNQPSGRAEPHVVNNTEAQNARRLAAAETELAVLRSSFQKMQDRIAKLERFIATALGAEQ